MSSISFKLMTGSFIKKYVLFSVTSRFQLLLLVLYVVKILKHSSFQPSHSSGCMGITLVDFLYFAVAAGAQASKCHFSAKGVSFSC